MGSPIKGPVLCCQYFLYRCSIAVCKDNYNHCDQVPAIITWSFREATNGSQVGWWGWIVHRMVLYLREESFFFIERPSLFTATEIRIVVMRKNTIFAISRTGYPTVGNEPFFDIHGGDGTRKISSPGSSPRPWDHYDNVSFYQIDTALHPGIRPDVCQQWWPRTTLLLSEWYPMHAILSRPQRGRFDSRPYLLIIAFWNG